MRTFLSLAALLAVVPLWAAPLPMWENYQKKADEAPWAWSEECATAAGCAKRLRGAYRAEVERRDVFGRAALRIVRDGKVVHAFDGHLRTAFAVRNDVLYYAAFHPSISGCAVVAFDLRKNKRLWRTELEGLGAVDHSEYSNAVNLDLEKWAVCVHGQERAGNYIEFVDLRSGKTVGHKVYPRK
jgi:hypothetical protein